MRWLSARWEAEIDSATRRDDAATQSGIVGDTRHRLEGGYHISRMDQSATNYSCVRPDDKGGPSDTASAIDMTFSLTADLVACHKRLRAVWERRTTHPLARYINAFNGWDGVGGAGRYDMVSGTVTGATADHKSHIHLELRRRYSDDWAAAVALRPLLSGLVQDEDDMKSFMKYSGSDAIFLTDGVTAKYIGDAGEVTDQVYLGNQGVLGKIGNGGALSVVTRRDLIGWIVGTIPAGWEDRAAYPKTAEVAVTMSDTDVNRVAKAVLDMILERMGDQAT
jgi:hypothetical protein